MARATQKTGSTNINSFTAASNGNQSRSRRPQTTGKYHPGMPVDPAADFSSNCDTVNHNHRPANSNTDLIVGHGGTNKGANVIQGKNYNMTKYH